jgi:2-keto-4-pentenoate hydratase/2-oxohepta-3-ene-1,7-dioic acid hydratase in catechol pathway
MGGAGVKLATFVRDGREGIGAVLDDHATLVDFARCPASPRWPSMQALIEAGERGLEGAARAIRGASRAALVALSEVRLRPPVPVPVQMRDCLVFEKHLVQARLQSARLRAAAHARSEDELERLAREGAGPVPAVWYERPIYYKQNRFTVIGPDEDVVWPRYSAVMDYELEWCVFLGRKIKDATSAEARSAIFGYSIFNDFSARDAQAREMPGQLGPAKGKDFDTGNAIGPWIVTPDEIDEERGHLMIARVNGEERSRGSSATMRYGFPEILAFLSTGETLYPGEFVGSGTIGDGCGHEHGRYLADGDVVELEVEGIGCLRNRVTREPGPPVALRAEARAGL